MTIRELKTRVQLLRNKYSAEKKRGVQEFLGSFPSGAGTMHAVPVEILEKLTDEESEQLQEWFFNRDAERAYLQLKSAPGQAARALQLIAKRYGPDIIKDEQIDEITQALSDIKAKRRAWKKKHANK